MHTAYHPDFNQDSKSLTLSEEESHHLIKVLRHKEGQMVEICNGKGARGLAKISLLHAKKCEVIFESMVFEKPAEKLIHLAIAPTKNMDRLEWFVEKATEMGVDIITLLLCKNNERKVVKMERLEKIVLSAMKQSRRLYLPQLHAPMSFKQFIEAYPKGGIAHCYDNDSEKVHLTKWSGDGPILIGPEGDFTLEEVNFAKEKSYVTLDLGNNRLRTETAAIYAVAAFVLYR